MREHQLTTTMARSKSTSCRLGRVLLALSYFLAFIWMEILILLSDSTNVVRSSSFLIDESFHHHQHIQQSKVLSHSPNTVNTTTITNVQNTKAIDVSVNVQKATTLVPDWMKEYMEWHREQRQSLTPDNWSTHKFLVLKCLKTDDKCAGTADHFKLLPVLLLLAHQSNRILLIHWERPAALEEFLLPPKGGLDWRLPIWLKERLNLQKVAEQRMSTTGHDILERQDEQTIALRILSNPLHKEYYEVHRKPNELSFDSVFQHMWSLLFEPSPPVAALIEKEMQKLGLVPGEYAAAHVRSLFSHERLALARQSITAIHCAAQHLPGKPIFFASDSPKMTTKALKYGRQRAKEYTVVARDTQNQNTPILHLDRGKDFLINNSNDWQDHAAVDYYDTFMDLYLLANSRCVSYGLGGFGLLGALLSYNVSCAHWYNKGPPCKGNRND